MCVYMSRCECVGMRENEKDKEQEKTQNIDIILSPFFSLLIALV